MIIRINLNRPICSIFIAALIAGCTSTSTTPPPFPPGTAADPQARSSANSPNNFLARDEASVAIREELSRTASRAKSAESMRHGDMPGMKMEDHQEMSQPAHVDAEKKAVAEDMKKTAQEMKITSEEMKQKSEQTIGQGFYYTCPMHPQIHAETPGKCPLCGMTLIKKEGAPPK